MADQNRIEIDGEVHIFVASAIVRGCRLCSLELGSGRGFHCHVAPCSSREREDGADGYFILDPEHDGVKAVAM
jgi:hypothetical protein